MKQLAYVSHANEPFSKSDLRQLMRKARRRNSEEGLTGVLLAQDGLFLQVLEGPEESLNRVFSSIERDPRHSKIAVIHEDNELKEREFGHWHMGCQILGEQTNDDYRNLDERLKAILRTSRPDGNSAHNLLLEFRALEDAFVDV